MNDSFVSIADSASSILILLPNKPYFDQVAAGLSLYLSLRDRKETTIYSPSPMTVGFNRLIGVNKISPELGSKNVLITFSNYDASNIEKVSYDIDNGQFKLTVVPKAGQIPPQKENINVSHSGLSADLVILIGGANDSHFPIISQKEFEGVRLLHIGTRSLDSTRGVMSFAKPGSSVSELIASLIKENELPIDADIATNLLMGIEEGSSNFTSGEVTPETFEIFAHLLRNGGQRQPKEKLSPADFPQGSIPTQPYMRPMTPPVVEPQVTKPEPIVEAVEGKEQPAPAVTGEESPPSDWLQPKIYKGTSVS